MSSGSGICTDEDVLASIRALRNACLLDTFRLLDSGTFAYVVEAREHGPAHATVALKILKTREPVNRIPHTALRELRALTGLRHPNILTLQRVYAMGARCIILQTARYDCSLAQYRREAPRLEGSTCAWVFAEVMAGVAAAHAAGVMHRDLKPGNILLRTALPEVVVADWGLARAPGDAPTPGALTGEVVTTWYAPPEVLTRAPYSFPADVWSLGIMLLELAHWKHVFRNTDRGTFMTDVTTMRRHLSEYTAELEPHLRDLLPRMLALEPGERATAAEVLAHPYCASAVAPHALPVCRSLTANLVVSYRTGELPARILQIVPPAAPLPPYHIGWPPAVKSVDKVALLELVSGRRLGAHWLAPYMLAMDMAWISGCDVSPSRMYACYTLAAAAMLPQDDLTYRDRRTSPYYGGSLMNNAYDLAELELEILQLLHGRVPWPREDMACVLALAPQHWRTAAYLASYPEVMRARGGSLMHVASACAAGDIGNDIAKWIELLVLL